MEDERGVLRVMPGDEIERGVEISSQSRLRYVWALFEDKVEPLRLRSRLVLGGEVYRFEKSGGHRVNFADLGYSEDYSDPPAVGIYRLLSMNCTTSADWVVLLIHVRTRPTVGTFYNLGLA